MVGIGNCAYLITAMLNEFLQLQTLLKAHTVALFEVSPRKKPDHRAPVMIRALF